MAKNDYYVIAYRILAYLYVCLKEGEKISIEYLQPEMFDCVPSYWEYIILNLYKEQYIDGVSVIPILGTHKAFKITLETTITPKGIEFLQNNSTMAKAREFLKTLKETIPGV